MSWEINGVAWWANRYTLRNSRSTPFHLGSAEWQYDAHFILTNNNIAAHYFNDPTLVWC